MGARALGGSVAGEAKDTLAKLGVGPELAPEGTLEARSPITGETITRVMVNDAASARAAIGSAGDAFRAWRRIPAPRRGELVRLFGEELRAAKPELARLVTIEAGKIVSESLGEVQEMIDICDYAVGLSRQLWGLTIATERPGHRMMETWHPLGVAGIITSFNFPVAVWAWNAALALVCGNALVWKPSEKTPLTALATQALLRRAAARLGDVPDGLSHVLIGGPELDEARQAAAVVSGGERVLADQFPSAYYARPAIVEIGEQAPIVRRETFAPILYVMKYRHFSQAIELHNGVPQGLASSIFTNDIGEAEQFLSSEGSDCGIANVNIGPSGAEIGGAFGGEKDSGGGREAGSDCWKAYMRRATNTINYSRNLPLAQGVKFDLDRSSRS